MPQAVILTALPVEYLAVRACLTDLEEDIHPKGTVYERGTFPTNPHPWNVGIVEIGAGNPGAAMEAERAITYFNPTVILFVGVAGGIKDDATLGDVVASTKVYGYESGKVEGEFKTRPELGLSAYRLEQRARAIARQWVLKVQANDQTAGGEAHPKAFVGPIAAGEKIVDSTQSAVCQFLRSHYEDALAVEMEGFGFLAAARANQSVSAMVIRGISALMDGQTALDWAGYQEIASRHAAQFAFEMLEQLQPKPSSSKPRLIGVTNTRKILFLSANPREASRLRLNEELREIQEGLRRSQKRDHYQIESVNAVRHRDIQRAMLDHKPKIVHFSGHGAGENGLIFENNLGQSQFVSAEALSGLFQLFSAQVECVVLNACYSVVQAQAIAQHIDYVIGMSEVIQDEAAIEFVVGFYDGLGSGKSYEVAYQLGCNRISLAGVSGRLMPQLLGKSYSSPASPADRYTIRLRDLLEAEKWREADQETLQIILEVTGQQQASLINLKNIRHFDNLVFQHLDELWDSFSNGKFSFSKQKEIWSKFGGHPGKYNYDVFCQFRERVGWWENGNWIEYSQFNFSLEAPTGHLPSLRWPIDPRRDNNWLGTWETIFLAFLALSEN